jgi:hypothetical protein
MTDRGRPSMKVLSTTAPAAVTTVVPPVGAPGVLPTPGALGPDQVSVADATPVASVPMVVKLVAVGAAKLDPAPPPPPVVSPPAPFAPPPPPP